MGISFQDHRGRRTSGHSTRHANAARQNASTGPGQSAKCGAFAKKPLVLHRMAAATTISRAARALGAWRSSAALSGVGMALLWHWGVLTSSPRWTTIAASHKRQSGKD